jgi:hypothetical protein
VKFCPQLNPLDPFHPLKVQAGNFVQPAVERTFGWVNRARRLTKDFEALISSSQAWFMLSMAFLLIRRIARDYETAA